MRERYAIARIIGLLYLITLIPVLTHAQEKDTVLMHTRISGTGDKDANILVIPFRPDMYVASGDQYICQQSRMTPGELADMIRRSLTSTLMYNMSELYNVVQPPDKTTDKKSDISVIYNITKIQNKYKKVKSYYKGYPSRSLWQIIGAPYTRWGTDCVNDNTQKPKINHHRFSKAVISNDSVYSNLCLKYNAHFALFITQFEMTTRFKNCVDLQDHVFQRDIFIHYTLFDDSGNYLDGGIVGTTYQSKSNDATKILDQNLGLLAGMIIERIRTKI